MDLKLIEIFTKIIDNKYKVNKHTMLNNINKWIVNL
jgi:hypothetical protein